MQFLRKSIIQGALYRPFDIRAYYHHQDVVELPRNEVMQHMMTGENLGLVFMRQVATQEGYNHFVATNHIVDNRAFYSNKGTMQLSPLYIYNDASIDFNMSASQSRPNNLSSGFLKDMTVKLGYTPMPEEIFYYIYTVFHSPTYRSRYAEFLKIDFPHVPLTSNNSLFKQLANYGKELVALHLMKSPKLDIPITQFEESGGSRIVDTGHPKYSNNKVTINKQGDGFTGVPEEVWNFYIGGYQVCQKWLKDRKKRALSDEDITHYQRIIVALKETMHLMQQIDEAIPSWPIE
jgi:predicted helicase